MSNETKIAIMLSMPKAYRDRLRTMAAEQNLKDPSHVKTASGIARDIVCEYLDRLETGSDHEILNEPS